MSIAIRLFSLLKERNKTQIDLADYLNVSVKTVSSWKTRDTSPPAECISAISEFLDVSCEYLLTGINEKECPDKRSFSSDLTFIIDRWESLNEDWKSIIKGKVSEGYLECQKTDQNAAKIS